MHRKFQLLNNVLNTVTLIAILELTPNNRPGTTGKSLHFRSIASEVSRGPWVMVTQLPTD